MSLLNPGDEVIVAGQSKVVSGQAVQAVEVTKAALEKQAKEAQAAQPAGGTGN